MTAGALIFLGWALICAAFIVVSVRVFQVNPTLVRKIFRYSFIFAFAAGFSIVSVALGFRISERHKESYSKSRQSVEEIWGGQIVQQVPSFTYPSKKTEQYEVKQSGELRERVSNINADYYFQSQQVSLGVKKNIRKKGLLFFPGYDLEFSGTYVLKNDFNAPQRFDYVFPLPQGQGNITDIKVTLDGKDYTGDTNLADGVQWQGTLSPGEIRTFAVHYKASGSASITYELAAKNVEVKNLDIALSTDFEDTDIPNNSMVPTKTAGDDEKTVMEWKGTNLVTGQNISVVFDIPGNYGTTISRMFMYSPVAIFLFTAFVVVFVVSREIKMHPMNYMFMLAGYFIFYLLGSYLVSYMNIILAIVLSLAFSTGLMVYYCRIIGKERTLLLTVASGAGMFQWIFSIAFFFPEHTGFAITIASILAFVALMKFTAKVDWENKW